MRTIPVFPVQVLTVQATTLCNLDCRYCYLPDRTLNQTFNTDLIPDIFSNLQSSRLLSDYVYWSWHAGEPLVAGLEFYRKATRLIHQYKPPQLNLGIGLQTNGTLISDDFARFFGRHGYKVGVSVDGPEPVHNHNRVFRNNKGSFQACMRGIEKLKKYGVPFHCICVLSAFSLDFPVEIYHFFRQLGVTGVAFSAEEIEGIHTRSSLNAMKAGERFDRFFETIFELHQQEGEPFQIREWNKFGKNGPEESINGTTVPFSHLSIDTRGFYSTFSPELLSIKNQPDYPDFIFGHIKTDPVIACIQHPKFQKTYLEIQAGVSLCKKTCDYFRSCGGGMVSNKLFENGSFHSSETLACRLMEKRLYDLCNRIAQPIAD